jgi:hypothetical protein
MSGRLAYLAPSFTARVWWRQIPLAVTADLAREPHPRRRSSFAAHEDNLGERKAKVIHNFRRAVDLFFSVLTSHCPIKRISHKQDQAGAIEAKGVPRVD